MPSSRKEKGKPAAGSPASERKRAGRILSILSEEYPDAHCLLDYRSPFELLVATILAAQCTDERVNMVTPALFKRYPTPEAMAKAEITDLEERVRSTGFFRNKAKSIKGASQGLAAAGEFPRTMEGLLSLPGVGRKTANVVLGNCFGVPAIIVDTHVGRVAQRLALSKEADPAKIEADLQGLVQEKDWTRLSHVLTFHGRKRCHARKPDCPHCPVRHLCPFQQEP